MTRKQTTTTRLKLMETLYLSQEHLDRVYRTPSNFWIMKRGNGGMSNTRCDPAARILIAREFAYENNGMRLRPTAAGLQELRKEGVNVHGVE